MKKILVIMLTVGLLFANSAFAGRFGNAKNSGIQRSQAPTSNTNPTYSPGAPTGAAQGQQRSGGMGAGTAAMLGAAAGAAGGYMLAKNSNNPNASGVVSNEARSTIPWGTILILIIILAFGMMFFRKKTHPGLSSGNPMNNFTPNNTNAFNMPNINRTPNKISTTKPGKPLVKFGAAAAAPVNIEMDKMPDGIETIYFLRQAKGMFLHIQSMNNADNLDEIQKYMTSKLFADTKDDIANNKSIADFTNLDCILMSCDEIKDAISEDGQPLEPQLLASVKFFGNVSDTPEQEPVTFSEIWSFVKSASTNNKWIVAGISQEEKPQN